MFDSLLQRLACVFPDQVDRRGRAAAMPDNHLVKVCQLAVMQQIHEFRHRNPNGRVPTDFFASVLTDDFTYKTSGGDGRPKPFDPRGNPAARSVPTGEGIAAEWALDPVDGRKLPLAQPLPSQPTRADRTLADGLAGANGNGKSGNGKGTEEAQGFYLPPAEEGEGGGAKEGAKEAGGEEKYDRFAPPMEVEYFPPAGKVKPPVKWDIDLNDDLNDDGGGGGGGGGGVAGRNGEEEREEATPEGEEERRAKEREEEEKEEKEREAGAVEVEANSLTANSLAANSLAADFPPVNPSDPYSHPSTAEDFLSYRPLSTLQESHPIRTVSFSPLGSAFCVGTNSKALRICRLAPGTNEIEVIHERARHHHGSVYCSSWSCDETMVATGSNDKTVKVVKVYVQGEGSEGSENLNTVGSSIEQNDLVLRGHGGTVRDVQFHQEDAGRLLSVGAHDNLCLVWDLAEAGGGGEGEGGGGGEGAVPVRTFGGHGGTVHCGRFSQFDTNLVATGGADSAVKVWDMRSAAGEGAAMSFTVESPVLSLLWSGRDRVLTSHSDGTVRELDARTGRELSAVQAHQDECRSLDATPCGRFVCTGGFDGLSSCFSTSSTSGGDGDAPAFLASLRTRTGGRVLASRWRPRGGRGMLVAGADCTVTYWGKQN